MTTTEPSADQAELFRRLAAGYDQAIRRYQVAYDAMLELSTDLARVAAPGKSRCLDFGTGTGAALPLLSAATTISDSTVRTTSSSPRQHDRSIPRCIGGR